MRFLGIKTNKIMERLKRTEKRRPHRPGGFNRSMVRLNRYQMAAETAGEEIRRFEIGESSVGVFFPAYEQEPDVIGHTIFDATKMPEKEPKGRNGDLAKRSGVIINTLLEEPQSFSGTKEDVSFVKRHFGRIYKFATTLRNKGRLHPQVEKILGL